MILISKQEEGLKIEIEHYQNNESYIYISGWHLAHRRKTNE